VADGALGHARQRGVDRVFCGHTHKARFCERDGVAYYNTGAWTDFPPTYITVGAGGVRIHEYHEPAEAPADLDADSDVAFAHAGSM
jgi:UDP-2,3-diacylglucosamine pyrophosphatase LpxH